MSGKTTWIGFRSKEFGNGLRSDRVVISLLPLYAYPLFLTAAGQLTVFFDAQIKTMKTSLAFAVSTFLLGQAAFAQDATIPQAMNAEASIPCPFAMPAGEVDGETISCGQIEVPENWDNPDDTTLTITYAILHSENPTAFTDPVVYFSGGPGESTVSGLFALVEDFEAIRRNRDVILWDPRGTTHSSNITCPADIQIPHPAAYDEAVSNFFDLVGRFDTNSDPDALYSTLSEHFALSDYGRCVPYWEEQGIDISQYSTQAIRMPLPCCLTWATQNTTSTVGLTEPPGSWGSRISIRTTSNWICRPSAAR
jgi:hypothetical protein